MYEQSRLRVDNPNTIVIRLRVLDLFTSDSA